MKDISQNYYCSNYYDVSVNKYGAKFGTLLRFWGNNVCINSIDPGRYFLGRRSSESERQNNR